MTADSTLDPGEEITIDYEDADYLDLFEIYGFFDDSAVIHTAEVFAPVQELLDFARLINPADTFEWRSKLIEEQAGVGFDKKMKSWWIADHHPEKSPLFRAARAAVVPKEELVALQQKAGQGVALGLPIAREAEVAEFVGKLVTRHLDGYVTTLKFDEASQKKHAH